MQWKVSALTVALISAVFVCGLEVLELIKQERTQRRFGLMRPALLGLSLVVASCLVVAMFQKSQRANDEKQPEALEARPRAVVLGKDLANIDAIIGDAIAKIPDARQLDMDMNLAGEKYLEVDRILNDTARATAQQIKDRIGWDQIKQRLEKQRQLFALLERLSASEADLSPIRTAQDLFKDARREFEEDDPEAVKSYWGALDELVQEKVKIQKVLADQLSNLNAVKLAFLEFESQLAGADLLPPDRGKD